MLHKDLTGLDLHIPKLHAPTHLVGGTDPLGLAESEIAGLVTDLGGKAPTVHSHVKADITDFPALGTAAALNVDADLATLALPANTTISAAGAELINDANAAAQLVTLGTAAYSEGTWTPTLNSATIVGAAPSVSGTYKRIGNLVFVALTIAAGALENTSVAFVNATTFIGNLPVAIAQDSQCFVIDNALTERGIGYIAASTGNMYMPVLSAKAARIVVTATYCV